MPNRWLFLPIKEGGVRVGSFFGLHDTTPEAAPLSAPNVLDSWLSAANGDPSGFWFVSFMADLAFPESFVWGELASVGMLDAQAATDYYAAGGDPGSILGNPGTEFIWAGGGLMAWPDSPNDDQFAEARISEVETLLIGGTLDFSTPAEAATTELLPYLPNGHQLILAEFGHSGDFWDFQPEAASRLLNTFYATGEVDNSGYTYRPMDFEKETNHSGLEWGFLGTMVGFAILLLLSLWWMPYRVRKRRAFGPKAGAWLRSVYPLVMGFGGWFLAVLIVMTIWPSLFIGNQLLAIISVGVPIALGIYWAWVHRNWRAAIKGTGLWASMGGAIIGGWFGFTSSTGLLALITTLIGAAIGANQVLTLLDITWDRSDGIGSVPCPRHRGGNRCDQRSG